MNELWYTSIPRSITILIAVALYGGALFALFRRQKRVKVRLSEYQDNPILDYEGPERRVYPRAKLDIDIRYRRYGKGSGLNIFKEGRAVDISEGGMGILLETYEKLGMHDKLELKLKLPIAVQFMLIRGDVVWIKEVEVGKWYRYGINFTDIDPNDKKMIAKYVSEHHSEISQGG